MQTLLYKIVGYHTTSPKQYLENHTTSPEFFQKNHTTSSKKFVEIQHSSNPIANHLTSPVSLDTLTLSTHSSSTHFNTTSKSSLNIPLYPSQHHLYPISKFFKFVSSQQNDTYQPTN